MDKYEMVYNFVFIAVIAVIGLYLWRVRYLASYLERSHPATWERLGRPTMQRHRAASILQSTSSLVGLVKFALVSGEYKESGDATLARTIWSVRALFLLGFLLMIVLAIVDPHGLWAALHKNKGA